MNSAEIIDLCSDKSKTFSQLSKCGIEIPRSRVVLSSEDFESVGFPCIIKPATGSGGSASVFFALNLDEGMIYAELIRRSGSAPLIQEYIDDHEGEFTIGVLSLPNKKIAGSIALRRSLDSKLSVSYRGKGIVISSGYTQGYIDVYEDICVQAEEIARIIGSSGPINIQGRVKKGVLLPFEINPRFSASTYLRSLAGFNEVDTLIKYLMSGVLPEIPPIKNGWYLRSLSEQYINLDEIR
jgi:carbamoyl-phosphate synthase large subunit